MESRKQVKTFIVNYICDKCGEGSMQPTGISHMTYPPTYPHFCPLCYAKMEFKVTYPLTVHEEVAPSK